MKMKHLLVLITPAIVAFFFFLTDYPAKAAYPFNDVSMYSSQIDYLYNQGIIKGYQDGTFHPQTPIKRLQAVEMILKQLGITDFSAAPVYFTDLLPGDYGYQEVAKAVQLGIINGKSDGSFDPWGNLTRAQMAVIMNKAFQLNGTSSSTFKDVPDNFWAKKAIDTLASNGITSGYQDDTFRPNQAIQRNHFSLFLVNYLEESKNLNLSDILKGVISSNDQSVVMIYGKNNSGQRIQQGSGFFVGKGLILTNFHVLDGAYSYEIVTDDGKSYQADGIVKYDTNRDLAILKVSSLQNIPPLKLGTFNTASTGDPVVTIGSPEGLMNTVSEGIVSGLRVQEDSNGLKTNLIQIDAPITHGNSGGPLLDQSGAVIGINSYGFDTGGNLNFAISIDYAKPWVTDLTKVSLDQLQVLPVNSGQSSSPSASPSGTSSIENTLMTFSTPIAHIVADPNHPIIYGVDGNKTVFQTNYDTQQTKTVPFQLTPGTLYLYGNTLYAGLQSPENAQSNDTLSGAIASIDTTTFNIKKQFSITLDPFDLVSDGTYVYVNGSRGPYSPNFSSFDLQTGERISTSIQFSDASDLQMDPMHDQLYIFNWPFTTIDISNGVITSSYDSTLIMNSDPRVSLLTNDLTLSPDGHYLFNGSGQVFFATHSKETNMTYAGQLSSPYSQITFDLDHNRVYTINDHTISEYNYNTFDLLGTYQVHNDIKKLVVNNGQLYAVAIVTGNKSTYVLEYIKLS